MALEAAVQRTTWLGLARRAVARVTLFRANSGKAWLSALGPKGVGRLPDGSMVVRAPRAIGLGLCLVNGDTAPGLSDNIGWTDVEITPEMVGHHIPVFTAVEHKRTDGGRKQKNQVNFIDQVCGAGGIGGFAASEEEAHKIIDDWLGKFALRLL